MLRVAGISKSYGARPVLTDVSFVLNRGECLGIVAPSGAGKTTLLRILAGQETADHGSVEIGGAAALGYVAQGHHGQRGLTAGQAFPELFAADQQQRELSDIAEAMASDAAPDQMERLNQAYEKVLAALSSAVNADQVEAARRDLALRLVTAGELLDTLSGGEQTKLALLSLVASAPTVLLLDEPGNNLDSVGLAWLTDYVLGFAGVVVLVSHDRALLDDLCTSILALDPHTGRAEMFAGNYSDFANEQALRLDQQWDRYHRQEERRERVEVAINGLKGRALRIENSTIHFHYRKRAAKVARRAVTLQRRLRRELDATTVDKPHALPFRVRADIATGPRAGRRMVAADGLSAGYGEQPLLRDVDLEVGWGERIAITGPNGSGKTTLLRLLMGEVPAQSGRIYRAPGLHAGYLPQQSQLVVERSGRTALDVIRGTVALDEGEARRFLHRFLFTTDQVFTPLSALSYGERRRLELAKLVVEGANLLLLDEPTNHLDIAAREAIEVALEGFEGALVVVSHDRYFIERTASTVLSLRDGKLVVG